MPNDTTDLFFERGSTIYPRPVAQACGRVLRARTPIERVDALVRGSETLARYAAGAAWCSFAARPEQDAPLPSIVANLRGYLAFGSFVAIIKEITGSHAAHPLRATLRAARDAGVFRSLDALVQWRNVQSHALQNLTDATARVILEQEQPAHHFQQALRAFAELLALPLLVIEAHQRRQGQTHAVLLWLMGEMAEPVPQQVTLSQGADDENVPYLGIDAGLLDLRPFLLWEIAEERRSYTLFLLHGMTNKGLKYITLAGEERQEVGALEVRLDHVREGGRLPTQPVALHDGSSLALEWRRERAQHEQQWQAEQGLIPWEEFEPATVRWYAQRLGTPAGDEAQARAAIIERLLDGRARLQPEELTQLRLLFGSEPTVGQTLRRGMLDMRQLADDSPRPQERVESARNILESLRQAIHFFGKHANLEGANLSDLTQTSGSADYLAMREALVNLFIHQDYSARTHAQIEIRPQRAIFYNPGHSLVSQEALLEGGRSQARNPLLARALRLIGFAELAGSGLRSLREAWRKEKRRPPRPESNQAGNSFTLTLDWRPLLQIDDPLWHTRLGVSLSQHEADALELTFDPDGAATPDIAAALGIPLEDAQYITQRLLRERLITERGDQLYVVDHLRDVPLLGRFEELQQGSGRLDEVDPKVLQAGFKRAWQNQDAQTILAIAARVPQHIIRNDPLLQRFVDMAKMRAE